MNNIIRYKSIVERNQEHERVRAIMTEKSDIEQYIEAVNIMQADYDKYIIALNDEISSLHELLQLYERYVVLLGGVHPYEMTES